ncbi:MAG TPA: hypothetical protein VFG47_04395 [Geminicoccaceae bacterium]|nr:hypothetical protein [Geminicoccaceae bacterium]
MRREDANLYGGTEAVIAVTGDVSLNRSGLGSRVPGISARDSVVSLVDSSVGGRDGPPDCVRPLRLVAVVVAQRRRCLAGHRDRRWR